MLKEMNGMTWHEMKWNEGNAKINEVKWSQVKWLLEWKKCFFEEMSGYIVFVGSDHSFPLAHPTRDSILMGFRVYRKKITPVQKEQSSEPKLHFGGSMVLGVYLFIWKFMYSYLYIYIYIGITSSRFHPWDKSTIYSIFRFWSEIAEPEMFVYLPNKFTEEILFGGLSRSQRQGWRI